MSPESQVIPVDLDLIKQIRDIIENHPTAFVMDTLGSKDDKASDCGTACCIAGWAIVLKAKKSKKKAVLNTFEALDHGIRLIAGTNSPEVTEGVHNTLVFDTHWPAKYQIGAWTGHSSYWHTADDIARFQERRERLAKMGVRLLDSIIEADGIWWDEWGKPISSKYKYLMNPKWKSKKT